MATKEDIETDLTLEVNGDVSPAQMAKALNALSALLNSAHRLEDPDTNVQWLVQVKKGSNLLGYYPASGSSPVNPAVLQNIQRGLNQLQNGIERPVGFTDGMMHNLRTLCEISKDTKNRKTSLRLWIQREPSDITVTIKSNVEVSLAGEFEEHGAIEGRLESLDAHSGYEFVIYEPLHEKKIVCSVDNDEIFTEAYKLFKKRVEAEGLIKYAANGIPYEITVERFNPIVEQIDQSYKRTRGILKDYV